MSHGDEIQPETRSIPPEPDNDAPAPGGSAHENRAHESDAPEKPTDDHREALPPPAEEAAELIETLDALTAWTEDLHTLASVAVDTEANSMYVYRERTCILQITAGGRSAIVDVLAVGDLSPLRAALDRKDVEVILHGGDYDVTVLTRDHDFSFEHVFDTMIAATLLGDARVGLAALVEDHFEHKLNKKFQRADWGRRPLTPPQLDYLRRDTIYLPALHEHYLSRLREADLEEEAQIEFRRLAQRQGKPVVFDPERWRRIKGAAPLDGPGRAILSALFAWREEAAEKRDLPPFKILSPKTLLALAQQPPRHAQRPQDLRAMGERDRRRHGPAVLGVIREALKRADRGEVPPKRLQEKLTPEEARAVRENRKYEDAIRSWRKGEAERRKVPNVVVLPNPAMVWLIAERPHAVDELSACPDIGPKRSARYGEKLIELVG